MNRVAGVPSHAACTCRQRTAITGWLSLSLLRPMLWREAPPPIPDHEFVSPPHSPGWWAPSRLCIYSFPAQTPWCIISTPLYPLSQQPCPSSLADQQVWRQFSFYIFLLKPGTRVMLNKSKIITPLWWPPTLTGPSSLLSKATLVPQPFVSPDSLYRVLAPSDRLVSGDIWCLTSQRKWWPLTGTPPLPHTLPLYTPKFYSFFLPLHTSPTRSPFFSQRWISPFFQAFLPRPSPPVMPTSQEGPERSFCPTNQIALLSSTEFASAPHWL